MRKEIKFRAWDKTNKMMLIPIRNEDDKPFMTLNGDDGDAVCQWFNRTKPRELPYAPEPDYDNCELMQFTGLKDNNGKEIYEGDIVKHKDQFGNIAIGKVVWKAPEFLLDFEKQNRWSAEEEDTGVEVMGNIYENPDLLEKSSD